MRKNITRFLFLTIISILFISCSFPKKTFQRSSATPELTLTPTITETLLPTQTPTPPPSPARVNGVYLWQEDVDRWIANQIKAAQETGNTAPDEKTLKDDALLALEQEALFESAAYAAGFALDPAVLDAKIASVREKAGGEEKLQSWMDSYGFNDESFRRNLAREMSIAWMRERIFAEALSNVEQIRTYQILVSTKSKADEILGKLELGIPFQTIAKEYDPIIGGNLDWIARGIFVYPELEDALFALDQGKFSEPIKTDLGYHLLFAAEKSTERPLSLQTRQTLEHVVLRQWLDEAMKNADITLLQP